SGGNTLPKPAATLSAYRAAERLATAGHALGDPHTNALNGTKKHALRELKCEAKGIPIRIAYAFHPKRQRVAVVGGHKTDARFYDHFVLRAEKLYDDYLKGG